MDNVNNLQKMFRTTGVLHNMVKEIGGDVAWFDDVNEAFDNLYDALEEAHMGAVAHLQMQEESVTESKACNCDENCPCGGNCTPDCDCHAGCGKVSESSGIDKVLVGDLNLILQRSGL